MDPPIRDAENPPKLAEISIQSGGQRMNAIFYVAAGRGPNPTVILLHGIPGNERNLDLAQALRRAGVNVLYFNYRGTWGSGGLFSYANALADVAAALSYVRSAEIVSRYHIDVSRVALVGHSFGGWVALMGAAADEKVACVACIDVANMGVRGRLFRSDPESVSRATANNDALIAPGAPFRAASGAAIVEESKARADEFDLNRYASSLKSRPVFLISAVNGDEQKTLVSSLTNVQAPVMALHWDTDHSFSDRRVELARTVMQWLTSSCRF
jgi:pimeloyl-ACP methyl ester carboxylesterase